MEGKREEAGLAEITREPLNETLVPEYSMLHMQWEFIYRVLPLIAGRAYSE
jgi:hypothetical protein